MSVIAAVYRNGVAHIGSDGQATCNGNVCGLTEPKVIVVGAVAIGIAGSARLRDLIEGAPQLLSRIPADPQRPHLTGWASDLRAFLLDNGAKGESGKESDCFGLGLVLATPTGLWTFDGTLSVSRPPTIDGLQIATEGSGGMYATGYLTCAARDLPPSAREDLGALGAVVGALRAGCLWEIGCGGALSVWRVQATGSSIVYAGDRLVYPEVSACSSPLPVPSPVTPSAPP